MPVLSLTTTRRQGHLRYPPALRAFLKKKKWPPTIATAEQVHQAKVVIVPPLKNPNEYRDADGLLTDAFHQPLGIFTADCVPLFLTTKNDAVIGVLHAGWRGVQKKILTQAVRLLKNKWSIPAKDIRIWPGPHIGPCCFEARWDVARFFAHARRRRKDRWTVDLALALKLQARQLGVQWLGKKAIGCTFHARAWHSYRRDATPMRQVSLIMKTPPVVQ